MDGIGVVLEDIEDPVIKAFSAAHILDRILQYSAEDFRRKLFTVERSTRNGDLKGFLDLRLVSKNFNEAVCSTIRKEFKSIQVNIDWNNLLCNGFFIGPYMQPRDRILGMMDGEDEIEIDIDDLPSKDTFAVEFLERFFKWLADTFEPVVERFQIFDSWSFRPCLLPEAWVKKLEVFSCMHPDMMHCECYQCIQIIKNCKEFGPLSFELTEYAWKEQKISYRSTSFTDAFLADIAMAYTEMNGNQGRFEVKRFIQNYGNIRCKNVIFVAQTFQTDPSDPPRPQPLEVIQLILRLWEVESVEFGIIPYIDNNYYSRRTAWEVTGAFHSAYFGSFHNDVFNHEIHALPFQRLGKLDRGLPHECLPIFDLRPDSSEGPYRMTINLSLLSVASENPDENQLTFIHQGLIAFNMFHNSRVMFIHSSVVDFRGVVGTANWLRFCIREMMNNVWGPRKKLNETRGKTVYWIHYVYDLPVCINRVWEENAQDLLNANFPNHIVQLNTKNAFLKCDNPRIAKYDNSKERNHPVFNTFYCTLQDPARDNITHIKIISIM